MTEQLPLLVRDDQQPQLHVPLPSSTTSSAGRRAASAAAHSLRKRKWLGRATVSFAIALLATVALMAAVSWPSSGRHTAKSTELETIMENYRARNFSGVVRLSHNGERKFSDWMGLANEEFAVPMEKHSVFPVGSNSKLFTSVAMHQLQERGRVNLSHAVNAYLDTTDFANFGFANQTHWCPRVAGGTVDDAPCENVTFVQLLNMGSGMGDGMLCDNAMAPYCSPAVSGNDLAHYKGSIAKHVGTFINAPLAFRPGANYSYSNANYVLLSYLIEKLSDQKLETYLSEQIFTKIGLKHTYYDPYAGERLVHRGFVNQYANFYVQLAVPDSDAMAVAAANNEELETREYLATGTCSPSVNSGALSGAGGIHSTAKDMHRVYKDLFLHRGQQSKVLREASIRALLLTRNSVRSEYAQGIVVAFDDDEVARDAWPTKISYCGRLKCAVTCMAMQTLGNDSVVASAFTNHVEYTFQTSDAFAQWQPTDDSYLPVVTSNSSSNSTVGSFEVGDYHVADLSWALLDVFLGYFKATEGS